MARSPDGREIVIVSMYGYKYHLIKAHPRDGVFRPPCFLGRKGFGLFACKKISSYKLKTLNFEK